MKKIISFLILSVFLCFGCQNNTTPNQQPTHSETQSTPTSQQKEKVKIVTTFYIPYEIAQKIGGTEAEVTNLVPAGAEPHDFEPTPRDMNTLYEADVVIYNGFGFEPWLIKLLPELETKGVKTIQLASSYQNIAIKNEEHHDEEHHEDEQHEEPSENEEHHNHEEEQATAGHTETEEHHHEELEYDPHFWLDPIIYLNTVEEVYTKLASFYPEKKASFKENTEQYKNELSSLYQNYQDVLGKCQSKTIITSHNAFNYLARRFDLEVFPIAGLSPEAEPAPKTLARLTDLIKEKNIEYVFTETLVNPKIAETLAREAGAKTLVLNPIEGLTQDQINQGENYISTMQKNLNNLQIALKCS